ncbi:MAG: UV DNA damage repair endonuclease UvsE [Eubacteriales bacterium]|nr:UV DNA damage repair endonuclease UvsE [Eubacteriales bacterium]MDD3200356.1 UV DNA damage repair endonuclease UvsE [Eubacteriales bacterium]MDD4121871.1 UV DNA damage repair endonuclease UvsE [Eubacteriales bacterium]MDD4630548.1 UV DNA damage repair endonuclease UvsE [Eubacteriales bacterium]
MSIGYACLTVGVSGTKIRNCLIKNATPEILSTLIQSNLEALDNILDYNIKNGIKLFRISSDIIPFGSHPVNTLKWWETFNDQLKGIGNKALINSIRLSMHPGQYTVLNSPDEAVVERAVKDLKYHTQFLDTMGLGQEHKIILHMGGIYGDKTSALKRFIKQYRCLDENIWQRLVIENDDCQYDISDVLSIGESEGIPVVFDNLHHQVNPNNKNSEIEWINACRNTWKQSDGLQKLHYSQQNAEKRLGSHSTTLDIDVFLQFYKRISKQDVDIMVEVKDKNLSAIKCINTIASPRIQRLEKEWERYKYLVLEHSPKAYQELRQLLKDKSAYPVVEFYRLIDDAMMSPVKPGNAVNAAQHVWGYFKDSSDTRTRLRFEKIIDKVRMGESTTPIKRLLLRLAKDQQQQYLMDSLYFMKLL